MQYFELSLLHASKIKEISQWRDTTKVGILKTDKAHQALHPSQDLARYVDNIDNIKNQNVINLDRWDNIQSTILYVWS